MKPITKNQYSAFYYSHLKRDQSRQKQENPGRQHIASCRDIAEVPAAKVGGFNAVSEVTEPGRVCPGSLQTGVVSEATFEDEIADAWRSM